MRALFSCLFAVLLGIGVAVGEPSTSSVTTYHGGAGRGGSFVVPDLSTNRAKDIGLDMAFHAEIEGQIYAQPLYWHPDGATRGLLLVATEADVVYALDALSGAVVWKRTLGQPVLRADLPCGNIFPFGVTGTPVIDESSATLYVDAAVMQADGVHHQVFALSIGSGDVLPRWPVDVGRAVGADFTAASQNQRGALTFFDGKVFVPFSGLWGDCGTYRGRVIAIPADRSRPIKAFATGARGGGIWGQGGVSSDGKSMFVATGNTMGALQWGQGEAVLRLAPDLTTPVDKRDFFTPSNWQDLDNEDLDLGGTAPLPLDVPLTVGKLPLVLAIGKDGYGYLLDRASLGGIGGQLAKTKVTTNIAVAGPAKWSAAGAEFVALQGKGAACPNAGAQGLIALEIIAVPTPAIDFAWCASVSGNGSPIVTTTDGKSNAIVWVIGAEGDNQLHAFDGKTGAPIVSTAAMHGLHHFQTLIATENHLYVAADGTVYAFSF